MPLVVVIDGFQVTVELVAIKNAGIPTPGYAQNVQQRRDDHRRCEAGEVPPA